jgi:hypothetical protein
MSNRKKGINIGVLECWRNGMLEYWNVGKLGWGRLEWLPGSGIESKEKPKN